MVIGFLVTFGLSLVKVGGDVIFVVPFLAGTVLATLAAKIPPSRQRAWEASAAAWFLLLVMEPAFRQPGSS